MNNNERLSTIDILYPIEDWGVGAYTVVWYCSFIYDGQIHYVDAERLLKEYPQFVTGHFAPESNFEWVAMPPI